MTFKLETCYPLNWLIGKSTKETTILKPGKDEVKINDLLIFAPVDNNNFTLGTEKSFVPRPGTDLNDNHWISPARTLKKKLLLITESIVYTSSLEEAQKI